MPLFKISHYGNDAFPLVLNEPRIQEVFPLHSHDYTELVIVRNGSGIHLVDSERYPIKAGDVFVITGKLRHGYSDTQNLQITNILLDLKRLPLPLDCLSLLPGYHALFAIEPKLRKKHEFNSRLKIEEEQLVTVNFLLNRLRNELKKQLPGYQAAAIGLFTELLVFLSRCYFSPHAAGNLREISQLGQVLSLIENKFAQDLSLADLSRAAHMSQRSFLRYFNNVLEMSPVQYLLKVRLAKAAEMLRHTRKPIAEIAAEVGFSDSNYFSRRFKAHTGQTPREFKHHFSPMEVKDKRQE